MCSSCFLLLEPWCFYIKFLEFKQNKYYTLACQGWGCFPTLRWKKMTVLEEPGPWPCLALLFQCEPLGLTFVSQSFMLDSILFEYHMLESYFLSWSPLYILQVTSLSVSKTCVGNSQIFSYIHYLPRNPRFTYSTYYLIYPHG